MASLDVFGLDDIIKDFENVAVLPVGVVDEILTASARIVAEAQKMTARSMLKGDYSQGLIADSITVNNPKTDKRGKRVVSISFSGKRHSNKIAEIAFVNEYGTTRQPARQFMRMAIESSSERAAEAAQNVLNDHFQNNNL